ncbi:MAG: hypothetical protein GXP05_01325 [Alphaproteobacteria bacterium]|nr:hypothetical protein [Alphaproteobacteria bacterium]
MTFEIALVSGSVLAVLSGVSIMNAWIEGRRSRNAAVVLAIAAGLLVWAAFLAPDGLQFSDIPRAFVTVIGLIVN